MAFKLLLAPKTDQSGRHLHDLVRNLRKALKNSLVETIKPAVVVASYRHHSLLEREVGPRSLLSLLDNTYTPLLLSEALQPELENIPQIS